MSLRDELKGIEVSEAERAAESVVERARSIPDTLGEAARVLERDYEGLLAIIIKYVKNTADMNGANPEDVVDQHKDFITGMASSIIILKEIAENRDLPNLDTFDS